MAEINSTAQATSALTSVSDIADAGIHSVVSAEKHHL